MRRVMLVVAAVACLVLVGSVALWLAVPKHRINQATAERIRVGMTQEEVEALIGVRPGNYVSGESFSAYSDSGSIADIKNPHPGEPVVWVGDGGVIRVWFHKDGKVIGSDYLETVVYHESVAAKLRRWFGF